MKHEEVNRKLDKSYYYKFGFNVFGPFLAAFSMWLIEKTKEKQFETVLFLARDGYMMKKGYDIFNGNAISSKYMYCSRKSLRQALLWQFDTYKDSIKYVNQTKYVTLAYMFDYYGFKPKEYDRLEKELRADRSFTVKYDELSRCNLFNNLYTKKRNQINEKSKKQDKVLLQYFNELNIKKHVAIVDVGWHASMQYYIEEFLKLHNMNVIVSGFYIGNQAFYNLNGTAEGYLFNDGSNPYRKKLLCFHGLLEKLFQSLEGTTEEYKVNDGKVKPICQVYEYANDLFVTNAIHEWQDGALDFVRMIDDSKMSLNSKTNSELREQLIRFGCNPKNKDIEKFRFLYNVEGDKIYYMPQKKLFQYKYSELKKNLAYSPWKTAFLKDLFKLPLPYFTIYRLLSK